MDKETISQIQDKAIVYIRSKEGKEILTPLDICNGYIAGYGQCLKDIEEKKQKDPKPYSYDRHEDEYWLAEREIREQDDKRIPGTSC